MKTGLLWFDDNPRTDLAEKIRRAAQRYQQKYGADPNVCYVHPSALDSNGKTREVDGVHVASRPSVLRHHFWLGQEAKQRVEKRQEVEQEWAL